MCEAVLRFFGRQIAAPTLIFITTALIIPIRNYVNGFSEYTNVEYSEKELCDMKIRKLSYGDKNIVGKNIERIRKEKGLTQKDCVAQMQIMGYDMNPTSYSKLEGQIRVATDREIFVLSKILGVKMEDFFIEK